MTEDEINDDFARQMLAFIAVRIDEQRKKSGHAPSVTADKVVTFDPPRYAGVETALTISARLPPSVTRFVALSQSLASGFRKAYTPPVDFALAQRHWLSACLQLMSENVLKVAANDWKTTLTITDAQLIGRFLAKAVGEMLRWLEAVQRGGSSTSEAHSLAAAIYSAIVAGHETMVEGENKVVFDEKMFLQKTVTGNMSINDRIILALLTACSERNASELYRSGPCPKSCLIQVEVGELMPEYDHTWRCLESNGHIMSCWNQLYERYTAYGEAKNTAERRAAFRLSSTENCWFDFYAREYCSPTPYHARYADERFVNGKQLVENIGYIEEITSNMCKMICRDALESPTAKRMLKSWEDLTARFALRCKFKSMPSYEEQHDFCLALTQFMELYDKAIDLIDKGESGEAFATLDESAPEDVNKQLSGRLEQLSVNDTDILSKLTRIEDKLNSLTPNKINYPHIANGADPYASKADGVVYLRGLADLVWSEGKVTYRDKPIKDQKAAVSYIWTTKSSSLYKDLIDDFKDVATHHGWRKLSTVYQNLKNIGKMKNSEEGIKRKAKQERRKKRVKEDLAEIVKVDPSNIK